RRTARRQGLTPFGASVEHGAATIAQVPLAREFQTQSALPALQRLLASLQPETTDTVFGEGVAVPAGIYQAAERRQMHRSDAAVPPCRRVRDVVATRVIGSDTLVTAAEQQHAVDVLAVMPRTDASMRVPVGVGPPHVDHARRMAAAVAIKATDQTF